MNGKSDLLKAKALLKSGGYTCVLVKGEDVFTSCESGISPLVGIMDGDWRGYSAADRIVGKAAAMLYAYMEVTSVYAETMSKAALKVFDKYGINYEYEVLTEFIVNRRGDGPCPMEMTVEGVDDRVLAAELLKRKVESMGR